MSDIIAVHRRDLVAGVQEAVAPLIAENKALAAELSAMRKDRDEWILAGARDVGAKQVRVQALEAALTKLKNEAGALRAFEDSIRYDIGNTNWECLMLRVREADALLPPVSTLCAICDQIKELHPNTHPWTARSVSETKGKDDWIWPPNETDPIPASKIEVKS